MSKAISFDGTSIQTNNIKIREVLCESVDHRNLNIQSFGARDGGKLVADIYEPRVIRISGVIQNTSESNLENAIDNFKELLSRKEKNLDVAYISGTRRFKASAQRITIERDYYNLTFAPFSVDFVVSDPPFGTNLDTTTIDFGYTQYTIGTWAIETQMSGTRRPMPIIQCTINSETNLTQINFTNVNTNETIKVPREYTAAEVLTIDTSAYTVDVDGTAVDYEGIFPEFVQGGNNMKVSFVGDNWNVSVKLIYYPLWL